MSLAPGTLLGPVQILSALGAGGMGEVYQARDTRLGRIVAIKTLAPQFAANGERRSRFEREALAVSALSHPHICAFYDVGQHGPVDFLGNEVLEGETLDRRLMRGPLPSMKPSSSVNRLPMPWTRCTGAGSPIET